MKLMISLFLSPMKLDSLQVHVSVRFFRRTGVDTGTSGSGGH